MKLYSRKRRSKPNGERGFTLFEVMAVLGIIAIVGSMMASSWADNAKNMKAKATAEKLHMVVKAAEDYMVANRADLLTLTGGGNVIAIPAGKTCAACAQPATPGGLQTIQADGYLPSSFIDSNTDQQSHALLVKQVGGELEAIVTTYGGASVADDQIGYISSLLGASAGGVYNNAVFGPNNQISGAQGSWGDATANWAASIGATPVTPSAGTVQVSMSMAEISGPGIDPDDVLHRTAQTDVTLNTMDTAIRMGGNSLEMQNGDINGVDMISGVRANLTNDLSVRDVNGRVATFTGAITGASAQINGNGVFTGQLRAGRMVDHQDPTFMVDPDVTTILNNLQSSGNTTLSVLNVLNGTTMNDVSVNGETWVTDLTGSGDTDLASLNVNGPIRLNGDIDAVSNDMTTSGWMTANRFSDSETATRFVNPAGLSEINNLRVHGALTVNGNTTSTGQINAARFVATDRMISPVYVTSSDRRLKADIEDLKGMDIIKKLAPKSYKLKDTGKLSMGFIAQDVEQFLPYAVHTDPETDMKGVNYIELIAPMVDAIQELETRVEELETSMVDLEMTTE
ncbi:tail fiber domain-containing protein [Sulfitobacter sp. R18_1]|uniref:tail fiber domain-containing protein n=1 Tax=Sulfitobacter sp. R18_1 TaxID=2821104 RepID=UPI001ADB0133|nr:tail fiber domain-containing protein [Sulfitobacter sp. R18_1]MBO9428471.1 tail fiber domain-containing protein [Sulfitobacter sp. R18_1]